MAMAIRARVAVASACILLSGVPAQSNPDGATIAAGDATISNSGSGELDIHQNSQSVIIDWQHFNIESGETTRFIQPGANALSVNRVGGQDPSRILGQLLANGRVILINGNGILFGAGARVNASSFIATTANAENSALLSSKADFSAPGQSTAMIANAGTITAAPGGMVALIAPAVSNNGTLTARLGRVVLGSSNRFTLDFTGDGLISFPLDSDVLARAVDFSGKPVDALVVNEGAIVAGHVMLSARSAQDLVTRVISMGGTAIAQGAHQEGGDIVLDGAGGMVDLHGAMTASGISGGTVSVAARNILLDGTVQAQGSAGAGGAIDIEATHRVIATTQSQLAVDGKTAGGSVTVAGGHDAGSGVFSSGTMTALSSAGAGGGVSVSGDQIDLYDAHIDVSGAGGGGHVQLGFTGLQTAPQAPASRVTVSPSTTITADAGISGGGGQIAVWSSSQTVAYGAYSVRGGANSGNGGSIETSSLGAVTFGAGADTAAPSGVNGTLLLDPRNLIIDDTLGQFPQYDLPDPDPDPGNTFGTNVMFLPNGNIAVSSPLDDFGGADAGAAYLFNKNTGALISTLTGSHANDQVGSQGFVQLTNDNYLIISPQWSSLRGAVTWASGTLGVSGAVGAGNSLVGSTANDAVGASGYVGAIPNVFGASPSSSFGANVVALPNGNYVLDTPTWDNGGVVNAGAVTLGNGATGTSGVISAANSIVGSSANDQVGYEGIIFLYGANASNFVVLSRFWDNTAAGATDAGAATWINGSTGLTGPITAANSLVGTHTNDLLGVEIATSGFLGRVALSDGNYVIASPHWGDGVSTQVGAVTWGNGASGVSGPISAANSLVGSATDDEVGRDGIVELALGDYVVASPFWNTQRGAVTWSNKDGSTVGAVSAANSLVGDQIEQEVGDGIEIGAGASVIPLPSGNYVVISPSWSPGGFGTGFGAVTWSNKDGSTVGAVSASNSLVGNFAHDGVGSRGVIVLTNGNYVVNSPEVAFVSADGAVTWGSGTSGISGAVSAANSLIYGTYVGVSGWDTNQIVALPNGNYVVASPNWNLQTGAVTWGDGNGGTVGAISSANSLTGSTPSVLPGSDGDHVGEEIIALPNGNYVIRSHIWNNGGVLAAGAVTVGSGTGPTTGVVSAANSLVGTRALDEVGSGGVYVLANGNFVVISENWNNGGIVSAGAATWGNKDGSTVGVLSAANSLVGSTFGDQVGAVGILALPNGNYVVSSSNWNNGAIPYAGASTWSDGNGGTVGVVSAANSLVGTHPFDFYGYNPEIVGNDYLVVGAFWNSGAGAVTLGNGTVGSHGAVSAANSIIGSGAGGAIGSVAPIVTGQGDFIVSSPTDGGGRVIVGFSDLSQINFSRAASLDLTITATALANVLNGGTNVTLQANNDITLGTALAVNNPLGNGGALTLQAGRSILINADITTDNGALTLLANASLASGVIDAQRLAGNAVITMAPGTVLDTGTGAVDISLSGDTGKTNHGAGAITLGAMDPSTILVENLGGGDVVLNGTLQATGAGSSIVIATRRNFINNAGAAALDPGPGRYVVYSQSPLTDLLGGLSGSPFYNTPYNPATPGVLAAGGNRFAYVLAPTLTVTVNGSRAEDNSAITLSYAFSGLVGSDTGAGAISGAPAITTNATANSPPGTYAIVAALGSLVSNYNYALQLVNGSLTITAATGSGGGGSGGSGGAGSSGSGGSGPASSVVPVNYGNWSSLPLRLWTDLTSSRLFTPCFCPVNDGKSDPYGCLHWADRCNNPCDPPISGAPGRDAKQSWDACDDQALSDARRRLASGKP